MTTKKKVTKKQTKKGVTKKATKKVAKKVVSKKTSKKTTKKATKRQLSQLAVAHLAAVKEKALNKKLTKEFEDCKIKGALLIGINAKGNILIKKESSDPHINNVINDILSAYEVSLAAKQLAPTFNQAKVKKGSFKK